MVFLVAVVSVLENNITAFLIVASLIEGYMLMASTYAIVTSSLTNVFSTNTSFKSEAWTMENVNSSLFLYPGTS